MAGSEQLIPGFSKNIINHLITLIMKKLFISVALLCLVVSVSSCSADDLNENLNTNEFQSSGAPDRSSPIENGDRDKDKDGDGE